jgi:broad specificity phosphatase PhoE
MKTIEIYVIRHGEAECNINFQENDNDLFSPLTENGIKQAIMTGEWFKSNNININLTYSSEMIRSIQTIELFNIDKPIIINKLLNERNLGIIERKIEKNRPMSIIKQFKLTPKNILYWKAQNGESQFEVNKRVKYFLKEISLVENILIVTHGYIIYAIRSIFRNIIKPTSYLKFVSDNENRVRNCQIFKLTVDLNLKFLKEESYYQHEKQWVKSDFSF